MGNDRKVTIITPVYNAEKDIEACILSVAGQTYANKEHLLIDGVSTDGTLEIIKRYAEKYPHIKLISEKDDGIYDAMNKGIDLATGEWLYFMGSDDLLYSPQVLEEIFDSGIEVGYDVVYGNVLRGNPSTIFDGKFTLLKLMERNLCHQSMFFRKTIFKTLGKFDIEFKAWADYLFNIKLFNRGDIHIKYIDKIIAQYGTDGFSSQGDDEAFLAKRELIFAENFPEDYVEVWKLRDSLAEVKQIRDRKNWLEGHVAELFQRIEERDHQIFERDRQIFERDHQIFQRNEEIRQLHHERVAITSSLSWKITAPIRWVSSLLGYTGRGYD